MNQKTLTYIKQGMKKSKMALKNKAPLFIKYLIYVIASFFGKLLFITYPLFAFADVRIAKTIEETKSFEIEKVFEDVNSIKKVWTIIIIYCLRGLITLAGIVVISGITIILFDIGNILDDMLITTTHILTYVFITIGTLLMLIYLIMVNLYLAPATYIVQTNDCGITEALSKSIAMMKKGKLKLLVIKLFYFMNFIVYLAICAGIFNFIAGNFDQLIMLLFIIILFIVMLLLTPKIVLGCNIASNSLYKDLLYEVEYLDFLNGNNINDSKLSTTNEEILVTLFDDTIEINEEN